MNAAPHWHPLAVDAATLATYCDLHPARRGVLLMLPMFTPSRGVVALIRVVARPPVDPCWGYLLVIPIRGASMLFGGLFFPLCRPLDLQGRGEY